MGNISGIGAPEFLKLRRRLFWVAGFLLLAAIAVFPLQQQIINVLALPLGDQSSYYITPVGGLGFIIKISIYISILLAIPLIIYHLYRCLEPLMKQHKSSALLFTGMSALLTVLGTLFSYFVSLPAALHFLTGLNIENVQALLTVDSYLLFVTTYLLVSAALFQIPLVLLIINDVRPLSLRQLMGAQWWVVLGAFILVVMISPTSNIVSQALLAAPIIVIYQLGLCFIWLRQRQPTSKKAALGVIESFDLPDDILSTEAKEPVELTLRPQVNQLSVPANKQKISSPAAATTRRTQPKFANRQLRVPSRSVDGIIERPVSPAMQKFITQRGAA